MTVATLTARVSVEGAQQAKKELNDLEKKVERVGSVAEKMTVALGAAGAVAGVYGLGRSALDAAAKMEALQQALSANTAGTAELKQVTADLAEIAKLPAINLEQAYMGFIQLKAAKLSTKEAEEGLRGIAKAAAAVAATPDQFGRAINGLQQIANSTKPLQEDINILREALPNAAMLLDKAFGSSRAEEIAKLGLSGREVALRFIQIASTLPAVSGGIGNMMVNMEDAFRQLNESLGRLVAKFLEAFGPRIQEMVGKLTDVFDRLAKNGDTVDKILRAAFGFLVSTAVVGAIKNVAAITEAFIVLRKAIQSVAVAEVVAMAIASPGRAAAGLAGALALGVGATFGINALFDAMFKGSSKSAPTAMTPAAGIPTMPTIDTGTKASGKGGSGKSAFGGLMDAMLRGAIAYASMPDPRLSQTSQLLDSIEKNTRETADVLQLNKRQAGGGELASLGVTAAEMRRSRGMSAGMGYQSSAVMGGSIIERQIRALTMDQIRRSGTYGIPRG